MLADELIPLPSSDGLFIHYGGAKIANISIQSPSSAQIDFYDTLGSGASLHVASVPANFVGVMQVERTIKQGLYVVNLNEATGSVGLA